MTIINYFYNTTISYSRSIESTFNNLNIKRDTLKLASTIFMTGELWAEYRGCESLRGHCKMLKDYCSDSAILFCNFLKPINDMCSTWINFPSNVLTLLVNIFKVAEFFSKKGIHLICNWLTVLMLRAKIMKIDRISSIFSLVRNMITLAKDVKILYTTIRNYSRNALHTTLDEETLEIVVNKVIKVMCSLSTTVFIFLDIAIFPIKIRYIISSISILGSAAKLYFNVNENTHVSHMSQTRRFFNLSVLV